MPAYNFMLGSGSASMVNVETLASNTMPAPKARYRTYSRPLELGDGTRRGAGWATAEWRWGFLTAAQRDALRAYCSGASATAYIRTRNEAQAYAYLTGVMVWPEEEQRDAGRCLDFAIQFRALTAFTPPPVLTWNYLNYYQEEIGSWTNGSAGGLGAPDGIRVTTVNGDFVAYQFVPPITSNGNWKAWQFSAADGEIIVYDAVAPYTAHTLIARGAHTLGDFTGYDVTIDGVAIQYMHLSAHLAAAGLDAFALQTETPA